MALLTASALGKTIRENNIDSLIIFTDMIQWHLKALQKGL